MDWFASLYVSILKNSFVVLLKSLCVLQMVWVSHFGECWDRGSSLLQAEGEAQGVWRREEINFLIPCLEFSQLFEGSLVAFV